MSFENLPLDENSFDKKEVLENIDLIIESLEDQQIKAFGEVPEAAALFYEKIRDLTDSVLREKDTTDRESFIRALEYRRGKNEEDEVIDFIIKNTRK